MTNLELNPNNSKFQVFNNPAFGAIRVFDIQEKPYFVGIEVARALEYTYPSNAVRTHCKGMVKLAIPSEGGVQETNLIPEGDVYRLIIKAADQSKSEKVKERATKFENLVFDEILPSIRKQGGYVVSRTDDTNEEIMARALLIAQDAIKRKDERLQELSERVNQQDNALEMKDRFIEELQPDAEYTREVLKSESVFNATQIAKEFGWGAPTLNEKLRQLGVQYRQNGQWLLSYRYQNKGYTKTSTWTKEIGGIARTYRNTVWTEKGRKFIHELLSQKQAI